MAAFHSQILACMKQIMFFVATTEKKRFGRRRLQTSER